jgi:hypothetical protein
MSKKQPEHLDQHNKPFTIVIYTLGVIVNPTPTLLAPPPQSGVIYRSDIALVFYYDQNI